MPSPDIRYPQGTFGYGAGEPRAAGTVVESFVTTNAVFAGAGVELDLATPGNVKLATTNGVGARYVGVANEAGAAGEIIPVTMAGPCLVAIASNVAAGDSLGPSATNAGEFATTALTAIGSVRAVVQATVTTGTRVLTGAVVVRL